MRNIGSACGNRAWSGRGALAALAVLAGLLTPLHAEEEVVYASRFDEASDLGKWAGRPGFGKGDPKLTVETEGAKEEGKPYLSVTADGKLGSGFLMKPVWLPKPGKTCVITFWFRNKGSFPVTYHLGGANQGSNGEVSGAWHELPLSDGWVQVNYAFQPKGESVSLEIAAGAEEYAPAKMAVYDLQIKQ